MSIEELLDQIIDLHDAFTAPVETEDERWEREFAEWQLFTDSHAGE